MKHAFSLSGALCASALVFTSAASNASLVDIGGGMIYDDVQDLTWTKNAGMSGSLDWQPAMDWATNLVFGGTDGWRLPTTTQFSDPTCSGDIRGAGDFTLFYEQRAGCTGGEMEALTEMYDPWGNPLFEGVNRTRYWTSTPYRDGTDPCINYPAYDVPCTIANDDGDRTGFYWQWGFTGFKDTGGPYDNVPFKTTLEQGNSRFAWAVHDGRVSAVPLPAAIYLFASGLIGLFGVMKRKTG